MVFNYARMAETSARLLERFAQGTVVLSRSVAGTPDEATPWIPASPTVTDYTLDAVVAPISEQFVDGTTILSTDLMVSAAPFGVEPTPGDTMTIDGATVTIIKIMRIPAAGTVLAWKFVVRA